MDTITIKRDNDSDLRFQGEQIAMVSSRTDSRAGTGRWTELTLFRTNGGKFVAVQVGFTQWDGEHERMAASITDTPKDVIQYLGHGWLAKELYDAAGIEDVQDVD